MYISIGKDYIKKFFKRLQIIKNNLLYKFKQIKIEQREITLKIFIEF